jgi:mono/diheme cytochrome c family protein
LVQALQVDLEWRTVTEIPEHLLKRSKERRGALAGETGDAAPAAPSSSAPAVAKAAPVAAAPAAPPPPKPDPAYVTAAKTRKKIPFWAMATLSLLPLWAFIYLLALQPREQTVEGPLAIGAGVYGSCAGCHGAAGQGGAGRIFANGEVLKTFPKIEDMLNFVYTGSQAYVAKELTVYGNPEREGGAHAPLSYNGNPMPAFNKSLSQADLLAVVRYEREVLSGYKLDPTQIDATGQLTYGNSSPYLDAEGQLVTPEGKPLFDADGKLTIQPDWTMPVGSK